MNIKIVRGDITKLEVDVIVNAANSSLLGGGGVDGAIHRAAGKELEFACRMLHGCKVGQAKITPGFDLSAKYIIHTVGPVWDGGSLDVVRFLQSCYQNSLELAVENQCESIAFPAISCGIYGYPVPEACLLAYDVILKFLKSHPLEVILCCFNNEVAEEYEKILEL